MLRPESKIPVSAEPVDDCKDCEAACCRGNEIMSLTLKEAAFMLRGGNQLITVALPIDYDRDDVVYPVGCVVDPQTRDRNFLVEKGREFEFLPAGYGRYILVEDCTYLTEDESGWKHCGVYEERPGVCRDFQPGSIACHGLQYVQIRKKITDTSTG